MPKKRNTSPEVPLVWRKMSSSLFPRPRSYPQPNLMGLYDVPLFPGQERSLPLPEGRHLLPTVAHLVLHRTESCSGQDHCLSISPQDKTSVRDNMA